MVKSFNVDLAAAGIDKEGERSRTVDLYAVRHTLGTHLSKNGVPPRTAGAAMRHSSLHLTMNVYIDPELLDVAGSVEALPGLSLGDDTDRRPEHRMCTQMACALSTAPVPSFEFRTMPVVWAPAQPTR